MVSTVEVENIYELGRYLDNINCFLKYISCKKKWLTNFFKCESIFFYRKTCSPALFGMGLRKSSWSCSSTDGVYARIL